MTRPQLDVSTEAVGNGQKETRRLIKKTQAGPFPCYLGSMGTDRLWLLGVLIFVCQLLFIVSLQIWAHSALFLPGTCLQDQRISIAPDTLTNPSIDIVVAVHNALPELQMMLASLHRYTNSSQYRLFLIDDRSNAETKSYLDSYAEQRAMHRNVIVEHLDRLGLRGYSFAVNHGVSLGRSLFVVILNSDVILSEDWLPELLRPFANDSRIAVTGPLSNAASYQSVPEVFGTENGRQVWSKNKLPPGWTPERMARAVRHLSSRSFPMVPFLNGFCLCIRRAVLNQVGLLDTPLFPLGYGEESDLLLPIRKAGYSAVLADSVYIYHHKTRSFSADDRASLAPMGRKHLLDKHTKTYVESRERELQNITEVVLAPLRKRLQFALDYPDIFSASSLRILFLLPSSMAGGGSTSVVQEALAYESFGITVRILLWDTSIPLFTTVFPEAAHLFRPWPKRVMSTEDSLSMQKIYQYGGLFDVVIATVWISVSVMLEMFKRSPSFLPVYYVQDYEPWFYPPDNEHARAAAATYAAVRDVGGVLLGKSTWIKNLLWEKHGVWLEKVPGGIETLCGSAVVAQRWIGERRGPLRIAAMVRPSTPRRNPLLTLQVLRAVKRSLGVGATIRVFGCTIDDLQNLQLRSGEADLLDFDFEHLGILNRSGIADLFLHSDVFVDLSEWQAFGRSAAEAMTCGSIALVTDQGGAEEIIDSGFNGFLVNATDISATIRTLGAFISDPLRLNYMQQNAAEVAFSLRIHVAVRQRLRVIVSVLQSVRLTVPNRF